MRLLQKLGAGIAFAGLFLVMGGGMHVRGGPDGTWVQLNLVHAAGCIAVVVGTVLSAVSAFAGRRSKADPESARIGPSEVER